MTKPNLRLQLLLVALLFTALTTFAQQSDNLPNIVFIYADDMGYGDVSCYGATDIETPHIDQIAQNGIKFTEFYSVSPVCSPSRYGLMTGRYPARDGIHGVFFPESWTGMDTAEVTMADMLKEVGYATGVVGKWHLGHRREYLPLQRGFDYYFGIPYSNDMEAVVYLEGNKLAEEDVDQYYTTQTYAEKAVQFIEDHQDEPFFLYMPHSMPHVPLYVSESFDGSSNRGLYGDVIQELDWSVGEVLQKLKDVGVEENTIVVVSSDNGPWLTMIDHGGSAGPLRAGKQTTFEGGMRVPCVVQWKAQIESGQTIDGMHNMMDWFPTFAAITGAPLPDDRPIDGENIAPVLLEGKERQGDQFMYYSHHTGYVAAYRRGDWKLKLPMEKPYNGRYTYAGEEPHGMLLFNLKEDPGEQNNLADEHPEMIAQMQQEIEQFKEELGETRETHRFKPPADKSHNEYLKEKYGSSQ